MRGWVSGLWISAPALPMKLACEMRSSACGGSCDSMPRKWRLSGRERSCSRPQARPPRLPPLFVQARTRRRRGRVRRRLASRSRCSRSPSTARASPRRSIARPRRAATATRRHQSLLRLRSIAQPHCAATLPHHRHLARRSSQSHKWCSSGRCHRRRRSSSSGGKRRSGLLVRPAFSFGIPTRRWCLPRRSNGSSSLPPAVLRG